MFSSFDDKKYRQRITDRTWIVILHVLLSVCPSEAHVTGGPQGRRTWSNRPLASTTICSTFTVLKGGRADS